MTRRAEPPAPSPAKSTTTPAAPAAPAASSITSPPNASDAPVHADATATAPRAPFEPAFTWDDPVRLMKSLGHAWREVTDRETPTFLQLIEQTITRVDVDEPTGFVAVHLEGESHHAIGLRRDAIVPLVAVLTGKSADEVKRAVSLGPAKIEAAPRPAKGARR